MTYPEQVNRMRKLKLISFITVTVAALALAAGCSNGANKNETKTENVSETQEKESENQNQGKTENIGKIFQTMDTTDITGKKVTKDVFAEKKLTMVNMWATWCGPCVEEIPELEEIAKEYKDGDVAIKGLPVEIDGQTGKPMAGLTEGEKKMVEDVLKETGATYQQLLASEDMKQTLSELEGFPTTYFINQKGELVGEPIVGSNSKDGWKKIIEERLKMLEEK